MRGLHLLLSLASVLLASCASPPRNTDTVTLHGRVIDRVNVAATPPKSFADKNAALHVLGVAGPLIGQILTQTGESPKHYLYRVRDPKGGHWRIHALGDYPVGTCLSIVVLDVDVEKAEWRLEEVTLSPRSTC